MTRWPAAAPGPVLPQPLALGVTCPLLGFAWGRRACCRCRRAPAHSLADFTYAHWRLVCVVSRAPFAVQVRVAGICCVLLLFTDEFSARTKRCSSAARGLCSRCLLLHAPEELLLSSHFLRCMENQTLCAKAKICRLTYAHASVIVASDWSVPSSVGAGFPCFCLACNNEEKLLFPII